MLSGNTTLYTRERVNRVILGPQLPHVCSDRKNVKINNHKIIGIFGANYILVNQKVVASALYL